jgi:hypothetical protein
MTDINRIEKIVSIMERFRFKRLIWIRDNKADHDNMPASLSRETEALVILKFVLTGNDETDLFTGDNLIPRPSKAETP